MKKLLSYFSLVIISTFPLNSQTHSKLAPKGFDTFREDIPHGTIDTVLYDSKTVGTRRKALVYTPPDWSKNKKYPVLYLLHGIGGDEKEWLNHGQPQIILDNLLAENKMEPMIVVLPNGRAMKDDRATGNIFDSVKVQAFAVFEKDLIHDLIPYIEKKYNVYTEASHRAVAGLSMGGGQALNFGLGNPGVFAWVGGFSSAPNTKKPEELVPDPDLILKKNRLLWISCGDNDNLISFSERTHNYLETYMIPHIYFVEPGGHDFKVWKNDLYHFVQLLFKPVDPEIFKKFNIRGVPASTNVRNSRYPQLLPDNRAVFRIKAPDAQKVQIDLGRKYDLIKGDEGVWEITTDSLSEGFHYYSLLINGVTLADPASETFYGMGRMASGIEVPFAGGEYYSLKDVPHGELSMKRYHSPVTKNWRQFYIYKPAGYDNDLNVRYPVLYLLHGGGEDQRGWPTQGLTDLIMDNLIADGKAIPMLIVMMDGNVIQPGFGEDFLKLFENELKQCVIPFVDANYRTKMGAEYRALAGLSMGGLQTLYAGIYNTEMFSYLGVFSSGYLPNQKSISDAQYTFIGKNAESLNQNLNLLWIAMGGKEDIAWQNCQTMITKFDELKFNYTYYEYPGGHTWPVWRNNLYQFAQLLFK